MRNIQPRVRAAKQASPQAQALSHGKAPPTADAPFAVLTTTHEATEHILPHRHDSEIQIVVPFSGVLRIETETALWILPPGKALIIPVGSVHSLTVPIQSIVRVVRLHQSLWSDAGETCRTITTCKLLLSLVETLAGFKGVLVSDTPEARLVGVLLDQLRSAPVHGFYVPRPKDSRLRIIVDTLMADPGNQVTLSEWSRRAGASERTLARLFDQEMGMGFRDCRRLIQMHSAVARLGDGTALAELAADLGYESLSAFIHAFRSVMGETPGQMARRLASWPAEAG